MTADRALKNEQVGKGTISISEKRLCSRFTGWSQGGQPGGGEMGDHRKSLNSPNKEISASSTSMNMERYPRQTVD